MFCDNNDFIFADLKMLMVAYIQNCWHQIYEGLKKCRGILAIEWNRYDKFGTPDGI